MTHPTDEELDALATRAMVIDPLLETDFDTQLDVEQDPYGAREAIETALYLIRDQAAAITTLRAQLADVQADLTFMTENRNKWQDSATQRWFRIEEAEARADRAEAALAAQLSPDVQALAVAMDALKKIADTDPDEGTGWFHDVANAALKGDTHE